MTTLSPAAATRMTEGLIPGPAFELLSPESVSAGLVTLVAVDAPSRAILAAGAGSFAMAKIYETEGLSLLPDDVNPEAVAAAWDQIADTTNQQELDVGGRQTQKFAMQAAEKLGVDLETFAQVGQYFFETARKDVEENGEENARATGVSLFLELLQSKGSECD